MMLSRNVHRAPKLYRKRVHQAYHSLVKSSKRSESRSECSLAIGRFSDDYFLRLGSSHSYDGTKKISHEKINGSEHGSIHHYSNINGTSLKRNVGSLAAIGEDNDGYPTALDEISGRSDLFSNTMQSAYRCIAIQNHRTISHGFSNRSHVKYRSFSSNAPTPTPPEKKGESTEKSSDNPSPSFTEKQTIGDKIQGGLKTAISSLVSILGKIPGVLWFYITNPKEFKEKLSELKEHAKKEAHHYYMGSKLLIADLRTAKAMLGRTLQGSSLTRRERKQLLRTVTDVFRLVPMSVFVLIPFMEFALPFALKLFPNMLPSTFQDSLKAEEAMKRELKSRIAMAEFFQE